MTQPRALLHALLHEARWRGPWRLALLAAVLVTAFFAFRPGPGPAPVFTAADKVQHLLAFGCMAFAGRLGFARQAALAAALLAYGGFIELVQTQVPGRDASWDDLVADALGIAAGLALVAWLRRRTPPR